MKLQRDLPLSELSSSVTSSCGKIGTSSFLTRTTQPTENGKEVCPETSPVRRSGTSTRIPFLGCWILTKKWAQRHIHLISRSPATLVVPTIVFLSLCACGFALTFMLARSEEEDIPSEVLRAAAEKGQWFSDQLHQAILPLFSMAQFVNQLEIFQSLPEEIGPAFENNSLPFVDSSFTHRNVTGVCDRPDLVQRFSEIAATIKRNSKMEGVLVNIQLAPEAVVCLLHPLNNTEDFPDGVFMDNTGALGHDLLADPERRVIAQETLLADKVTIAGPLSLKQCRDCDPTVEKAFIARLPIDHAMDFDGKARTRWGFAVALINWEELIGRSNIYETFSERDLEFQLTRTDRILDARTGNSSEQVVLLAGSDGFLSRQQRFVTTALDTTNNEWIMTVGYNFESLPTWKVAAATATVLVSLCITVLVYTILMQKQIHSELIAEKSALLVESARKAASDERELNDFIAHEVRNPLSAAMSACAFVSSAVNETQPLIDIESQNSVREDVRIIEASLHFINELLRSMLDIHRAASKQMVLEMEATDILRDVFEPVSSMLYRRDDNFQVLLACDENLVVCADRLRLQQVVLNLGRNAAKFVGQGFVRLRATCVGDDVCIYVEDSGPSIPMGKRKDLFCRFQESLDSLSQGTGIGLNLCKELVDLMGGSIFLDESYISGHAGGDGTRIVINLRKPPIESSGSDNPELETLCASADECNDKRIEKTRTLPAKLSVLIVDDERILRKLASRSISKIAPDWSIREAASGETALQLITCGESFDLIFMDQYMTSTDRQLTGTETVRELRSRRVNSIVCGLSANDLQQAFTGAGANYFIMKPFPCKAVELETELLRITECIDR
jgi:signal transduction histidine kinase